MMNSRFLPCLLKLGDRCREVQHVVAALEESIDPSENGVVLYPPGIGRAFHRSLGLVVKVHRLKATQNLRQE